MKWFISFFSDVVRGLREIERLIEENNRLLSENHQIPMRTVAVVWTGKLVGESGYRSDIGFQHIQAYSSKRITFSSVSSFGSRVEKGSCLTVIGGFAVRVILGNQIIGAGQSIIINELVEPGQELHIDLMPV